MNYGFFLTEAVSLLCSICAVIWGPSDLLYTTRSLIFHVLLNLLIFYPMSRLMRYIRQSFDSPVPKETWYKLLFFPVGFLLLLVLFYRLPLFAFLQEWIVLELFTKAMEVFMLFLYYHLFRILDRMQQRAKEYSRLEAIVANYKNLAQTSDKLRELRHEFTHHIQALSILMESEDYEGTREYLGKLGEFTDSIPAVSYTSHPLLNSILTQYYEKARELCVDAVYHIQVPLPLSMEDVDLCQLSTNLLDNALEASGHIEKEKRSLSLTIKQNGDMLFLSLENACDGSQIVLQEGYPRSTKPQDGNPHGLGIRLMERIANKYDGSLKLHTVEDCFKISVILCLREDRKGRKKL